MDAGVKKVVQMDSDSQNETLPVSSISYCDDTGMIQSFKFSALFARKINSAHFGKINLPLTLGGTTQ